MAATKLWSLLPLFLILFLSGAAYASFEFLKMAHQWPRGFCGNPYNGGLCQGSPLPDHFVPHGVWPTNYSTFLSFCDTSRAYVPLTKREAKRVDAFWPDLTSAKPDTKNQRFHKRQWLKHGTCFPPSFTQGQFFQLVEQLSQDVSVDDIFLHYQISQGNFYHFWYLNRAMQLRTGYIADFKWFPIPCSSDVVLEEVRICYNPTATSLIDCPRQIGGTRRSASCANRRVYIL